MAGLLTIGSSLMAYAGLRRSQWATAGELERLVRRRLDGSLRAARSIPFYRERLGQARADREGVSPLAGLPELRREDIRALAASVAGVNPGAARAPRVLSSGSTGDPVPFLFDGPHQRGRFAARLRFLVENGWTPRARTAWVIGLRPGGPDATLTTSRVLPGASFLSHILPVEELIGRLETLRPRFLYSLPSTVEALALTLEASGRRLPGLELAFTSGEVVDEGLRERVRRGLGVEIVDAYGATEAFPAWQCPSGGYHVNSEHVLLEVVDDAGAPVAAGRPGRVLLTTLENRLMPLIRWEIGDWVERDDAACSCGRGLPVLRRVLGRGMNLFRRPDGGWLSPWTLVEATKEIPPVRQVQIVQHAVDRYTVRVASGQALEPATEQAVRRGFDEILGAPVAVRIERVDEVPRTRSGKLLAAVSEVR